MQQYIFFSSIRYLKTFLVYYPFSISVAGSTQKLPLSSSPFWQISPFWTKWIKQFSSFRAPAERIHWFSSLWVMLLFVYVSQQYVNWYNAFVILSIEYYITSSSWDLLTSFNIFGELAIARHQSEDTAGLNVVRWLKCHHILLCSDGGKSCGITPKTF